MTKNTDTITLTTDIGMQYAAQMKGVILRLNPNARIIDITHDIRPHAVLEGAFVLYSIVPHFKDAVHIGVIDPGVGTARKNLVFACERGYLVGPDNGLLVPAARSLGLSEVYELVHSVDKRSAAAQPSKNPNIKRTFQARRMWGEGWCSPPQVSNVFHGRDIFAPAAVHISAGVPPAELGEPTADYVDLNFGEPVIEGGQIRGQIIFIDRFGNLITNIPTAVVLERFDWGDEMRIELGVRTLHLSFARAYGYAEPQELIATLSSAELLEIACNVGDAREVLGAKVGDDVKVGL